MPNKAKGFTLIELLIVVAIIGILAALLIPNALAAIQKAKQKGTMQDMNSIATALSDYIADKGAAPLWSAGLYTTTDSIYTTICPFYMKAMATKDQWGQGFRIYCGPGFSFQGITSANEELDEYVVASGGRNATFEFGYDSGSSPSFLYEIHSMVDFNNDLINWDGQWICVPRIGGATS